MVNERAPIASCDSPLYIIMQLEQVHKLIRGKSKEGVPKPDVLRSASLVKASNYFPVC
jgi:hypothetical protein